jgi:hypothetical protein
MPEPLVSRGALRFIEPNHLRTLLLRTGFRVDAWLGDWDRTPLRPQSPEVIVVALAASRPGDEKRPRARTRSQG